MEGVRVREDESRRNGSKETSPKEGDRETKQEEATVSWPSAVKDAPGGPIT